MTMIIVMLTPPPRNICHEITIEERMDIWYQKKTAEKNGK